MTFRLPDHWVWDFWIADDGELFHLFYLHAPKSLGDPELRHRNASIGHATSPDLSDWMDHGQVLAAGEVGAFDADGTWTGSVLRGPDGVWRLFYTGARFLSADSGANVETIAVATSPDLFTWSKQRGPILTADPRWYERLDDGSWREEAWRDPWVFPDPEGEGWHMYVTARARGPLSDADRGVIGHAASADLATWTAVEPLSRPHAGFLHLEVLQHVTIDGRGVIVFSCDTAHLAGERLTRGEQGGVWAVESAPLAADIPVHNAQLLIDDRLYAGRVVTRRDGRAALMGFEYLDADGEFVGRISDPLPLSWDERDRIVVGDRTPVS